MTFLHPFYLLLLLLLLPLAWRGWRGWQQETAVRRAFSAAPAQEKMGVPINAWFSLGRTALFLVAWTAIVVGLARPQGDPILGSGELYGSDIMLAVDVSDSMRALDSAPGNRLNGARTIINTMLQGLQGDRLGLMAFAGSAVTLCPLTDDYGVVGSFVDDLDFDAGVEPGSNLMAVITMALRRFPVDAKDGRALIIFTDGEDLSGQVEGAVELATQRGIPIVTVGLGSSRGSRIPVGEDMWGNLQFKTFEGQEVVTRLEADNLKRLARMSGGRYFQGDNRWRTAQDILSFINSLKKQALRVTRVQQFQEYFPWLLGLAVAALLGELALTLSRYRLVMPARRKRRRPRPAEHTAALWLLVLLAYGQVAWSWPWQPYQDNNEGVGAFDRQDYSAAEQNFRRAADRSKFYVPWYNLGNTFYKEKRYHQALNA